MPLRSRAARMRPALASLALTCTVVACAPPPAPEPVPTAAPSAPTTAAPTVPTRIVTMHRADGVRSAIVHHPDSAAAGAPLVVVLHSAAVSASTTEVTFGWDALADRDGFVVAYPEGVLDGFQDTWNAGRCCPPADELPADDVGFLDALVPALRRTDAVGHRVYAVGFSNGAMLAYAWACGRPGTLTGMGVVAGSLTTDCPAPAPLSVVAVHGAADDQVPLGGGPGPSGTTFPSLDASLAPFRVGCAEAAPVAAGPARVEVRTCPDGRRVVTAVVDGLAHTWPGAGPAAGTSDGPLDATGFLWARLRG